MHHPPRAPLSASWASFYEQKGQAPGPRRIGVGRDVAGFAACTAFLRSARSWSSDSSTPGARSFFTWSAATGILFAAGALGKWGQPSPRRRRRGCLNARVRRSAAFRRAARLVSAGRGRAQRRLGIAKAAAALPKANNLKAYLSTPLRFATPYPPLGSVAGLHGLVRTGAFIALRSSERAAHTTQSAPKRGPSGRYGTCGGLQVGQGELPYWSLTAVDRAAPQRTPPRCSRSESSST